MYNEQLLIDKIIYSTSYEVRLLENNLFENVSIEDNLPIVFVGHLGINLEDPADLTANSFRENNNRERLITSISFVCKRNEFHSVREKIKQAYSGWTPYPLDANFSSLVFVQAKVRNSTNNLIWWEELVCLHMPRIS